MLLRPLGEVAVSIPQESAELRGVVVAVVGVVQSVVALAFNHADSRSHASKRPSALRFVAMREQADLDESRLRALVGHGEDVFVERKAAFPSDGLGRVAASFA